MQKNNDQPSNVANFVIILLIILSGYLLYSLTLAFYKSYQIDVYIEDFEQKNQRIEEENKKLIEEFDYVTSDLYIDKILKQNNGLINPGEEVVVIASTDNIEEESDVFDIDYYTNRNIDKLSNVDKWRIFIFEENPF